MFTFFDSEMNVLFLLGKCTATKSRGGLPQFFLGFGTATNSRGEVPQFFCNSVVLKIFAMTSETFFYSTKLW